MSKTGTVAGRRRGADMSPDTIAAIRRMRLDEGKPVAEVAAAFGIGPGTVSRYASTKPRVNPERGALVVGLARKGTTQQAIIAETGVPYSAVSDIIAWAAVNGYVTKKGLKLSAGPVPFPPVSVTRGDGQTAAPAPVAVPAKAPVPEVTVRSPAERATTLTIRLGSAPDPHVEDMTSKAVTLLDDNKVARSSLRSRLLKAIAEDGPHESTHTLMAAIRQPTDNWAAHEVQHILASLNQQGLIKYRTDRRGTNQKLYTRIEATKRGFEAAGLGQYHPEVGPFRRKGEPIHRDDPTDFRSHKIRAEGGVVIKEKYEEHRAMFPDHNHPPLDEPEAVVVRKVEPVVRAVPVVVVPAVVEDVEEQPRVVGSDQQAEYPQLALLRQRAVARAEKADRAQRYLDAAAILEDVDPDESKRLLAIAEGLAGEPFSVLEMEYMAYAEAHRG